MIKLEVFSDKSNQSYILYVNGKHSRTFFNWDELIGFWKSLMTLIPNLPVVPEILQLSILGLGQ